MARLTPLVRCPGRGDGSPCPDRALVESERRRRDCHAADFHNFQGRANRCARPSTTKES